MCVPCAAAAPELLPFIGYVLLILLAIVAGLVVGLWRVIPYVSMAVAAVSIALYRWFSGAVLAKETMQEDDVYWETEIRQGRPGPRITRPVRATARLALTGIAVGLLINPLLTALLCGTLSVVVSGGALYGRRDRVITTARHLSWNVTSTTRRLTGKTRELVKR